MNALFKDIHALNFSCNHSACKLMPEWTCFSFYLEKGEGRETTHGIIGNEPSGRVLGKELAVTSSVRSKWQQLSMHFKK